MKKLFYFFAIAGATMTLACNNETKKATEEETTETATEKVVEVVLNDCSCGECEQCLLKKSIEEQIAAYEALMAETGDQSIKDVMNKRSYFVGVDMGFNIKNLNEILDMDIDYVMTCALEFYVAGNYEDESFTKANEEMNTFFYTTVDDYARAKQMRDSYEAAGITENLPELPELYSEEMPRKYVATIIGYGFGAMLKDVDNLDWAWFTKGFTDAIAIEDMNSINEALLLTTEELSTEFMLFQQDMMAKAMAKMEQESEENKAAGEAWLAEVEQEEGVQKTESGLLYRIDRKGEGAYPTQDSAVVEVHYEGTLQDGTVFDSSYERGETISFPLNGVIKGWTEGLKLINEGGQITLWIPAELAYGTQQRGEHIQPNSALKFKVELVKVTE